MPMNYTKFKVCSVFCKPLFSKQETYPRDEFPFCHYPSPRKHLSIKKTLHTQPFSHGRIDEALFRYADTSLDEGIHGIYLYWKDNERDFSETGSQSINDTALG